MTRAEKHKEVIQHFINGGEVEYYNGVMNRWEVTKCPNWYIGTEYRIKQEPEYIPFDFSDAEQLIGKMIKSKDGVIITMVTYLSNDGVTGGGSFQYLFENFVFLDGSPFGKLKQ